MLSVTIVQPQVHVYESRLVVLKLVVWYGIQAFI